MISNVLRTLTQINRNQSIKRETMFNSETSHLPCDFMSIVTYGKLPRTAITSSYFSSSRKCSRLWRSDSFKLTKSWIVLILYWILKERREKKINPKVIEFFTKGKLACLLKPNPTTFKKMLRLHRVLNLQWFYLKLFNFTILPKQYALSKNHTLEFWSFPGLVIFITVSSGCWAAAVSSSSQSACDHKSK